MTSFFQEMDPLLRTFWFIALPVSLIFLIQLIMTFVGMDASDGIDADFDSNLDSDGPFQLFSLRNLINFLLGFSWAGITFFSTISSHAILIIFAMLVGAGFIWVFFLTMKKMSGFAEDNTFNIASTVGKVAQVYLTIPADKNGKGKVQISVNGAVHEIDAVTTGDLLESGAMVRVESVLDSSMVMVNKL